jgi:choline-glycine betaine transporter
MGWLLQLSGAVSFFFVIYLMYKFGHLHLARRPDEKPEFYFVTVVALMLASTVGPGLIVFGAGDPLQQTLHNFFVNTGYRSQDERIMFGMNLSIFMWGMMSWTHVALVAIGLLLASHRFGLPLTFRSCFFPLLGAYTWGWIGDFIDGIAVVSAVVGACASTTFACYQIAMCLVNMGWLTNTAEGFGFAIIITIVLITVMSTASAISGLRGGVRFFTPQLSGLVSCLHS